MYMVQCEVGHVVCSACHDNLEATAGNGKCHVCSVVTGYRRCHAMEQLVDCTRVVCTYAAHGCDATPPYHGQESHHKECPHVPCHCPGESCGFIGSIAALMDHFAAAHNNWPCTAKETSSSSSYYGICLRDGFNFFHMADHEHYRGKDCSVPCLFLLNLTRERLGRAISVLCIHPDHTNGGVGEPILSTPCELALSGDWRSFSSSFSQYQTSEFQVACTDLSNGLPSPDAYCHFIVPNSLLGDSDGLGSN